MRSKNISFALALITLPSFAFGLAQDAADTKKGGTTNSEAQEHKTPHFASASQLIGMNVWSRGIDDKSREDVGDIRDYVVDGKTGTLTHVVVSSGGVGSIGDTLRRMPYSALQFDVTDPKEMKVWVDMKHEDFKALPAIEKSVLAPYAGKAIAETRIAERAKAREANAPKAKGDVATVRLPEVSAMLVSELDDLDLRAGRGSVDAAGEAIDGKSVGSIHEAWIDCFAGKVAYLTVEHNGRQVVVPMAAMSAFVDYDDKSLYFETPCSMLTLATAPAIDEKENLTLQNAAFRATIDSFYAKLDGKPVGEPSSGSSSAGRR